MNLEDRIDSCQTESEKRLLQSDIKFRNFFQEILFRCHSKDLLSKHERKVLMGIVCEYVKNPDENGVVTFENINIDEIFGTKVIFLIPTFRHLLTFNLFEMDLSNEYLWIKLNDKI